MEPFELGDAVFFGESTTVGVIVKLSHDFPGMPAGAWVVWQDEREPKLAALSGLRLAEGPIDDEAQQFHDWVDDNWLPRRA